MPTRIKIFRIALIVLGVVIILRLFMIQVADARFFDALAERQYTLYQELFPGRGEILVQDFKDGTTYAGATNVDMGFVYADPRNVEDPKTTAETLGGLLSFSEEETLALLEKLSKQDDPYEPIKRRVSEELLQ